MATRTIAAAFFLAIPVLGLAAHPEPAKAKKFQFALVSAFGECDTPNTATQTGSVPACAPPFRPNVCNVAANASGKLTAVVVGSPDAGTEDIKFVAKAKGITGCEGIPLCVRISFRVTTDDCPEGSCTTTDFNDIELVGPAPTCCTISNGVCKIETTLLTTMPGTFAQGKNAGIELLSCGLKELGFPLFPDDLRCGILLK